MFAKWNNDKVSKTCNRFPRSKCSRTEWFFNHSTCINLPCLEMFAKDSSFLRLPVRQRLIRMSGMFRKRLETGVLREADHSFHVDQG